MNWLLFLFGLLGLFACLVIEVSKVTPRQMNWTSAAIRYGLLLAVNFAVVYWINTIVVQTMIVPLAICGAGLVLRNNISFKK